MRKRDALEILTDVCRRRAALSVATMQAVPVWHELAPDLPLHMDMLGCMGSASSFGLGLALGAPDRPVVVVDGDGSLMMQLATLVSIGHARARNLTIAVMRNGTYETSGNQPVPGAETADLVALARAAGFQLAERFAEASALRERIDGLIAAPGPVMVVIDVAPEEPSEKWPTLSMKQQFQDVRGAMLRQREAAPTAT
ncbi:MAG: thiamine pyrophosphate-binding protein [Alphaproteobacteria bacterium]|nr:thiamine pyrophosphate-binding protein [Alphaproteobacteria bacterium]